MESFVTILHSQTVATTLEPLQVPTPHSTPCKVNQLYHVIMYYLADPGEARDCSTNGFVTN